MECLNYRRVLIEGAFRLDPAITTLDQLHVKTDAVMARATTPALDETVEDDGIVISRELAKEILTALDNATGFGAYVPRRIANNAIGDYADSVRLECGSAAMRLRRAALAQEAS